MTKVTKPPYIKFFIKDFAFSIRGKSKEQIGDLILAFFDCYENGITPDEFKNNYLFETLKETIEKYNITCERNKQNRNKSNTYPDESSTNRQPLDNDSMTTLVKPRTKNKESINNRSKIVNIHTSKPVDNVDNSKGSFKKIDYSVCSVGSFDIRNYLKDDDYIDICGKINSNWDRNLIFEKYNNWVKNGEKPKNPRKAFLGWLDSNSSWLKVNP